MIPSQLPGSSLPRYSVHWLAGWLVGAASFPIVIYQSSISTGMTVMVVSPVGGSSAGPGVPCLARWLQVSPPDLTFARRRHAVRRAPNERTGRALEREICTNMESGGWMEKKKQSGSRSNPIGLCVVRYSRTKSTPSSPPTHACMDGMEAWEASRRGRHER